MKFFKANKYSLLSNILRYSFIVIASFVIILSYLFIKVEATSITVTPQNITQNSVDLVLNNLETNPSYAVHVIKSSNQSIVGTKFVNSQVGGSATVNFNTLTPYTDYTVFIDKTGGGNIAVKIATTNFKTLTNVKINSFTPASGKTGDTVTIIGENFTGASKVFFGEIANAIPATNNGTTITVVVPHVAVTGTLYVVTDHGEGSSATDFIVMPTSGTQTCSNGATDYPTCTPPTSGNTNTNTTNSDPTTKGKSRGLVPDCNVGAINPNTGNYVEACDFNRLMEIINTVINFLLITLATPLFVLIIVYVAWLYLSAGGSSENVTKAKKIIKNALIGYIIALAAWLIVKTILATLGFNPKDAFLNI